MLCLHTAHPYTILAKEENPYTYLLVPHQILVPVLFLFYVEMRTYFSYT